MSEVECDVAGHVGTIRLNAPERLNALSPENSARLAELYKELDAHREVRVIVITGTGRAFCSGAAVGGLVRMAKEVQARDSSAPPPERPAAPIPFTAHRCGVYKPVIAAVNGLCAAAGLHFIADADIVISAESATFFDPHTSVGQVAALEPIIFAKCGVPMNAITRMVVLGRGERLDAQAALRLGLVSEVVPDDVLMKRVGELADLASESSPAAVKASLRVIWESLEYPLGEGYNRGFDAIGAHRVHPDAVEGATAFVEKRRPVWSE